MRYGIIDDLLQAAIREERRRGNGLWVALTHQISRTLYMQNPSPEASPNLPPYNKDSKNVRSLAAEPLYSQADHRLQALYFYHIFAVAVFPMPPEI